jgi:hypothetical protein
MKVQDLAGCTYGVRGIDSHTPKGALEVNVIEGYSIDLFINHIKMLYERRSFKDVLESIADNEPLRRYETGSYGILRIFDDNGKRRQVVDVPPAFDSYQYIDDNGLKGIALFDYYSVPESVTFYAFESENVKYYLNGDLEAGVLSKIIKRLHYESPDEIAECEAAWINH